MDLTIGDDIYCPAEFWSGRIVELGVHPVCGTPTAILRSHDPSPDGPFLSIDLLPYRGLLRNRSEVN